MAFIEEYRKAKTWADMETVIRENLTGTEIGELIQALNTVKRYMGIDARQSFTLGLIESINKYEKGGK